MNPILYFWLMLKASLLSTGGMGNLPSLHADLLIRKQATEEQFAEALTIGQISPGPNGLWVISFGYLNRGILGAIAALIAVALPPLLAIPIAKLYTSRRDHPGVIGFVRGMSLGIVGAFAVVMARMLAASHPDGRAAVIALATLVLAISRRVPLPVIIASSAIVGAMIYRHR